jgi:hypothetical protein
MRRPSSIYIDHERPHRTSWWDTPAGRMVGRVVFRIGVAAWATMICLTLVGVVIFALILLIGLARDRQKEAPELVRGPYSCKPAGRLPRRSIIHKNQ